MAWYDIFNSGDDAPVTRTVRDVQEATAGARGPTGSLDPGNTIPDVLKQYGYDSPEITNAAGYSQRMAELRRAQLKKDYTLPKPQGMEMFGNILTGAGDMVGQVQNPPHVAAMLHGNNRILQYLDRKKEYEDKLVGANKDVTDGLYNNIDKTIGGVVASQLALAADRAKYKEKLRRKDELDAQYRAEKAARAAVDPNHATLDREGNLVAKSPEGEGGITVDPDAAPPPIAGAAGAPGDPGVRVPVPTPVAPVLAPPSLSAGAPSGLKAAPDAAAAPRAEAPAPPLPPDVQAQLSAAGKAPLTSDGLVGRDPRLGAAAAAAPFGTPMHLGGPKPAEAPPSDDYDEMPVTASGLTARQMDDQIRAEITSHEDAKAMMTSPAAIAKQRAWLAEKNGIPRGTREWIEYMAEGKVAPVQKDQGRIDKLSDRATQLETGLNNAERALEAEPKAFSSSWIFPKIPAALSNWIPGLSEYGDASATYEQEAKNLALAAALAQSGGTRPSVASQAAELKAIGGLDQPHGSRRAYIEAKRKEIEKALHKTELEIEDAQRGRWHYTDGRMPPHLQLGRSKEAAPEGPPPVAPGHLKRAQELIKSKDPTAPAFIADMEKRYGAEAVRKALKGGR